MELSDVLLLLTGIAFFLYGMSAMGDGLKAVAGSQMESYLWKMSSTPWKAFLLGVLATAVIQSSSATSVMAISFVNAGMMGLSQAVCVMLGANIGTTMTGWILSLSEAGGAGIVGQLLSTTMLVAVLAAIGAVIRLFAHRNRVRSCGLILIGLGTILLSMSLISQAVEPLKTSEEFRQILVMFRNPFLGILAGLLVAAVVQSCSAAVGILQAMCVTGALSYGVCMPIILGMNIGASVPVLLAMIGSSKNGKRAALTYPVSNIMSIFLMYLLYLPLSFIPAFSSLMASSASVLGIAVMNTVMRILAAFVLLPLHRQIEKINCLCVPVKSDENADEEAIDCLSESVLNYPLIALERSRSAVEKMAELARANLTKAMGLIGNFDRAVFNSVQEKEALVDKYEDKLGNFVVKIGKNPLTDDQQAWISCLLGAIGDFERLSDHAANLSEVAAEINEKKIVFSEDAAKEINLILDAVREVIDLAFAAFETENLEKAAMVDPLEEIIDEMCKHMRSHHIKRLQNNECTILTGFVFNDMITNLERVSDHCSNIAFSILHSRNVNAEEHEYAARLASTPEYTEGIHFFKIKYLAPISRSVRESLAEEQARQTPPDPGLAGAK